MVDKILLQQMEQAKAYFSANSDIFVKVQLLRDKMNMLEKHVQSSILWNIIKWCGFGAYVWKLCIPYFNWYDSSPLSTYLFNENILTLLLNPLVYFFSFILLYVIPASLLGSWLASVRRKTAVPMREDYNKQVLALSCELSESYNTFEAKLGFPCPVPFERCHPKLIAQLIDIMRSGRADSVKEAINIVVQDEQNARAEALQRENNKRLKSIESRASMLEAYAIFDILTDMRKKD